MNIYGAIGYILLNKNNSNILILSDKHDKLEKCDNYIKVDQWLKTKFVSSTILLEEVPRENVEIKGLWPDGEHTESLKNLYLDNNNIIIPIDIRPHLIPFSWEIEKIENDIELFNYVKLIDDFFCLKNNYLQKNLSHCNLEYLSQSMLGIHFIEIKKLFNNYLITNKKILFENITKIKYSNNICLESINDILNMIMEWYICALIQSNFDKPIIIHTGLFHSNNLIKLLVNKYKYSIIDSQGINYINEISNYKNGCIQINDTINKLF